MKKFLILFCGIFIFLFSTVLYAFSVNKEKIKSKSICFETKASGHAFSPLRVIVVKPISRATAESTNVVPADTTLYCAPF